MSTIPPLTHPYGAVWKQPNLDDILIDDTHAIMDKNSFDKLYEYSTSYPSGVYEGKIWKSKSNSGQWFLRWYGNSEEKDKCSINTRILEIV